MFLNKESSQSTLLGGYTEGAKENYLILYYLDNIFNSFEFKFFRVPETPNM
jgi:hypothetical protein